MQQKAARWGFAAGNTSDGTLACHWSRPTLRSLGPRARWCSASLGRSRPASLIGLFSSHSSLSDGRPSAGSGNVSRRLPYLGNGGKGIWSASWLTWHHHWWLTKHCTWQQLLAVPCAEHGLASAQHAAATLASDEQGISFQHRAGDMQNRSLQRVERRHGAHRLRLRRDVRPVHSGGRSVSLLSAADSCSNACKQVEQLSQTDLELMSSVCMVRGIAP